MEDFEIAISFLSYQNEATQPTFETREIQVIAYHSIYQSEPVTAWIPLTNQHLHLNPVTDSPDCFGDNNGSIEVNPTGGLEPYSFEWFNGQMTDTISGLNQGVYSVTLTDSEGCQKADTIELFQPDSLVVVIVNPGSDIVCDESGVLNTTTEGGIPNYTYLWNDGSIDANRSMLGPGNYLVTVTDNNGCTDLAEYTLTEDTIFFNQIENLCAGQTFEFKQFSF